MKITIDLLDDIFYSDKIYQIDGFPLQMNNYQKYSQNISKLSVAGLYILLGPQSSRRQIYIGQTMNLSRRLKEHQKGKDFWTECLCFFDKEQQLTKTEVEWLEQEMIKGAISCNYYDVLTNYQVPVNVVINDLEAPRLNSLLEQIKLLLNAFGCPIIKENYNRDEVKVKHSNDIISRIARSYLGEISKKDPYLEEDEDGIFHYKNEYIDISYMYVEKGIYIFKDSIISLDNQNDIEKNELLKRYNIKNAVLEKDILIKNDKELKILIK